MSSQNEYKATAVAGSNIAFVKYWGNMDDSLRLPMNGSLSMTLDAANTTTTIHFHADYKADRLTINGHRANQAATQRAAYHLEHLRQMADVDLPAKIVSTNSFPTGAGIASSASGFAALTVAAAHALNLDLPEAELSRLARLGSGSASRSISGGFVEWFPGGRHEDSYAVQIAPPEHWNLVDIIAIISAEEKEVGSTAGHPLAHTSPFYQARLGELQTTLPQMRRAVLERDFEAFGELLEAEAISLHVAAMTSNPRILYWTAGTITLMHKLQEWRNVNRNPAVGYFTIDAGPNIHIMTTAEHVPNLLEKLNQLSFVQDTLVCHPGSGAHTLSDHLF
ncbi:MAG: diphosphomevalonate decarboxylase [Anaerolineales bacterium]|nr:diphosphomevalonate decarboxylase [Anaerolineales bacterium]